MIAERRVPWNAVRLGCRVEYHFRPTPPRNGSEAIAADDAMLGRYMHLHALNRGILLTPFHNMALMSPDTTDADVDLHTGLRRGRIGADRLTTGRTRSLTGSGCPGRYAGCVITDAGDVPTSNGRSNSARWSSGSRAGWPRPVSWAPRGRRPASGHRPAREDEDRSVIREWARSNGVDYVPADPRGPNLRLRQGRRPRNEHRTRGRGRNPSIGRSSTTSVPRSQGPSRRSKTSCPRDTAVPRGRTGPASSPRSCTSCSECRRRRRPAGT